MPDSQTTTVDIIARRLYDAGRRYAFGIPGGEVLAMMNALSRIILIIFSLAWPGAGAGADPLRSNDFGVIFLEADAAMNKATREARRTLGSDFFKRMESPSGAHSFMLKIAVPIGDGRHEHVWVGDIRRIGKDRGAGKLDKDLKWLKWRAGSTLLFHEKEISDWRFMLEDKMHGARTTRVLLRRFKPDRANPLRKLLAPLE